MFGDLFAAFNFDAMSPDEERLLLIFMIVYLCLFIFLLLYSAVVYVLQAIGMQTIAKRRCIHHPWLAWIPLGNLWLLGSISDQYQYLMKGRIKSRRWGLPVLAVLTMCAYLGGAYCVYLCMAQGYITSLVPTAPMLLAFVFVVFFGAGVVVTLVQAYICLYNLFASCEPDNRKLFLILSILCPVGIAFIVCTIRKRDAGMPPRKQPAPIAEEPEEITKETEGDPEDEQEEPVADA